MVINKFNYTLLLLSTIFIGGQAKSNESTTDLTDLLIVEGIFAATFLFTANDPEDWGNFFIITSPIVLGGVESKTDYWLAVAASTAYGIWLVDQEDEKESELFKKQFLTLNAVLIPFWIYKNVSDTENSEKQSQLFLETDPVSYGVKLNYTFRF